MDEVDMLDGMTDGERIGVGLVGYGFAGRTFHAPVIRRVEGMELRVVGSSRPEAVEAAMPGTAVCAAEEVAGRPELDLVVIATPNESHFPLAAAALRAGKDVVVDKPFVLDLAEARELVRIAKEEGRLLSVFQNRRWESEVEGARAAMASGELGVVTHFECHMDRFRPNVRKRWREEPGPGAGLWYDLGPHLLDIAVMLFGAPERLGAELATLRPGGLTDDWAHVRMEYPGLRVILNATLVASPGAPRTVIHGTKGSWMKFGMDVQEAQLMSGMAPGDAGFGVDADAGVFVDGATGERRLVACPVGHQQAFYEGMRDAMWGRGPVPVTPAEALVVMAALEATYVSSAAGGVAVELGLGLEERR